MKKLILISYLMLIVSCASTPNPYGLNYDNKSRIDKALEIATNGNYDESITIMADVYEKTGKRNAFLELTIADNYSKTFKCEDAAYWYAKSYKTQEDVGVFGGTYGLTRTALLIAGSYFQCGHANEAVTASETALKHARDIGDDTKQASHKKKSRREIVSEAEKLAERINTSIKPLGVMEVKSSITGRVFVNSIDMEFIEVPAGSFMMGSDKSKDPDAESYETPQKKREIYAPFFISKYEINQKQWYMVMGTYPSKFKGSDKPVESVSWHDAVEFISKLNAKESTDMYRLPTQEEWEYAARAGSHSRYFFSDDPERLPSFAWMYDNTASTRPTGTRHPNPWGLHDIYGNVSEWCADELSDGRSSVRGCSWDNSAVNCRSAQKYANFKTSKNNNVGFRIIRTTESPMSSLEKRAESGDMTAINKLGDNYLYGTGVSKDHKKALDLYRRAAISGDLAGTVNLGYMYDHGKGTVEDDAEAVRWYRKAAEKGHAVAQANMGTMYENGAGIGKDYAEAVKWYKKAADQGNSRALSKLALIYENGTGVRQSYRTASVYYRKAAEQGYGKAQNSLGILYYMGNGISQSYTEARKWFLKAANQGNSNAEFNMALLYDQGLGVEKDMNTAVKWYMKAAKQGHVNALDELKKLGVSLNKSKGFLVPN